MGFLSDGGSQKTTSTPWKPQIPYLESGFAQAQSNLNTPAQYYQGSTYTPFAPQTELGMDMVTQRAINGSPVNAAANNYAINTLNGSNMPDQNQLFGAINNLQNTQVNAPSIQGQNIGFSSVNPSSVSAPQVNSSNVNASNVSASTINPSSVDFSSVSSQSVNPNSVDYNSLPGVRDVSASGQGFDQLGNTASGSMMGGNPFLDQMFQSASESVTNRFNDTVMPGINATFGGAGRTGSGIHGATMGRASDELGTDLRHMAADIYGQDYAQERGYMNQAANTLANANLQSQGMNQGVDAQGRQLAGQFGLANQSTNLQGQLANQDSSLRAGLANQSAGIQTGLANQDAGLRAGMANQSSALQAGLANQSAGIQTGLANQDASLRAGLANQGASLNASLANQDAGLRAGMANQSAGIQTGQLNQANSFNTQAANAANSLQAQGMGLDANIAGTGMMGNLYGQGLSNQNYALSQAGNLAAQDYADAQALMGVGGMVEGKANQILGDDMNRYNFYQNAPDVNLQNYIAAISGQYGGTTKQSAKLSPLQTVGQIVDIGSSIASFGG